MVRATLTATAREDGMLKVSSLFITQRDVVLTDIGIKIVDEVAGDLEEDLKRTERLRNNGTSY